MPYLRSESDSSSTGDSESEDDEPIWYTAKAEDSEDSDYETDPAQSSNVDKPWEAAVRGRSTESKPPRFDIEKLRPWEVMFADEKGFDTYQREG